MSGGLEDKAAGGPRDLVARIALGDRAAETEFIASYARGVQVLMRRSCRVADAVAEDLSQEVLANVLQRLRDGAIREAEALPAYVRSTIVRMAAAEYRKRRPESGGEVEPADDNENPSRTLYHQQLATILRQLLGELSVPRDRELLSQYYLEERSKDEVCANLRIDPEHFHRVVFRARERFRELIEKRGFAMSL